jgi:cell wall-associated NlpC family hydrolase
MIFESVYLDIKAHAQTQVPHEACGFIVLNNDGDLEVVTSPNINLDPRNRFTTSPESYLRAKKLGSIVGLYHSHPQDSSEPTAADRIMHKIAKVPGVIYSVGQDTFTEVSTDTQDYPLMGREFVWGIFDCGTLIRDYYRDKVGITLEAEHPTEHEWITGARTYLPYLYANNFTIVPPISMKLHDIILVQLTAQHPNHAGIYIGANTIFHHLHQRLSTEDIYGDYWRDRTTHVLRHKELL